MSYFSEALAAMLAAIGLATLVWLAMSLFFRREKSFDLPTTAVVSARGSAPGLEYTVRRLEQLRCERGGFETILILDCGLNEVGLQVARLLAREDRDVELRGREDLPDFFQ